MKTIQEEIKQTRPFPTLEEEAIVSLARTAAVVETASTDLMKSYGLTVTLYNVLRILRGAGPDGLCRYEVRDRLITPEPDVTRLLDRLEKAGFVTRERNSLNRREVKATITKRGLDLLDEIDGPLRKLHDEQVGHMDEQDLRDLIRLLAVARSHD